MSKKCSLIPKVRNLDGKVVDSRLFQDLLSLYGRDKARSIYLRTKNLLFEYSNPSLKRDSNGEFLIEDILALSENVVIKNIDISEYERLAGTKKNGEYVKLDLNEALIIANRFNEQESNKDVYALVSENDDKFKVEIFEATNGRPLQVKDLMDHQKLAGQLKEVLNDAGIDIGQLTDREKQDGISGVVDFSELKRIGNGLISAIRVSNNQDGIHAIPEEFAHLAIAQSKDNPIVKRLINSITPLIAELILGDKYSIYLGKYKFDDDKVAEEAAGKIVAKKLFENASISDLKNNNIISRAVEAIKSFFKRINATGLERLMMDINTDAANIAELSMKDYFLNKTRLRSINRDGLLYSLISHSEALAESLKKAVQIELKRFLIFKNRTKSSNFTKEQKEQVTELRAAIQRGAQEADITMYLKRILTLLDLLDNKLKGLNTSGTSPLKMATVMRDIKNYLYSYGDFITELNTRRALYENEGLQLLSDEVVELIANTSNYIHTLKLQYDQYAIPIFRNFISQFTEKSNINTDELMAMMTTAELDISLFDRLLDSMSSSADTMNRLFAQAVNKSKDIARLETVEVSKLITKLHLELEAAGHKNTDFMYARYRDGSLTGNIILEVDYDLFFLDLKQFIKESKKQIKDPSDLNLIRDHKSRLRRWKQENSSIANGKLIPNEKYKSKQFKSMSLAQRAYYDGYMALKQQLDELLPLNGIKPYKAILIRKDMLERIKSKGSLSLKVKGVGNAIKYSFVNSVDDVEYETKSTLKDFEGNQVWQLPVYYTRYLEDSNELSTDATSGLIAYASMANDYNQMHKVVNVLEVGRDIMMKRAIKLRSGGRALMETVNQLGEKFQTNVIRSGAGTNVADRLNDFFLMLVYSRYMDDDGYLFANVSKAKVADLINKATAINSMALNVLSGIANINMGKLMMRIEAFAGEFFKWRDVVYADKTYSKEMPYVLGLIADRVKTNKLDLWIERFNVMQDYEDSIRDVDMDKKGAFARLANTQTLTFMLKGGEHWMQTRTSLALANLTRLFDKSGKSVSLYDAYEVVNETGKNGKVVKSYLKLKDGLKKLDGTDFTKDDEIDFSKKSKKINLKMHGIYNKLDKNAIQKHWYGRMAMLFRKWIPEAINRRFQASQYDFDLDSEQEGYYRTLGKFLKNLSDDIKALLFDILTSWDSLSDHQKANIKRSMTELGAFALINFVTMLLGGYDDKGKKSWIVNMIEYQLYRMRMEVGAITPTPAIIDEAFNIIKSPAAGVRTAQDIVNLLDIVNPYSWTDMYESGKYRGHSKAYKSIMEIIPMNRTVHKVLNPQEASVFFK